MVVGLCNEFFSGRLFILNLFEFLVVGFFEYVVLVGVVYYCLIDCYVFYVFVVRVLYFKFFVYVDVVFYGARIRVRGIYVYFIRFIYI